MVSIHFGICLGLIGTLIFTTEIDKCRLLCPTYGEGALSDTVIRSSVPCPILGLWLL